MSDEPITNYRRVRTTEGWEPGDDLSTEVTPSAPSAELPHRGVWFAYNHTRREYVSGAPWPRGTSVDDNSLPPTVRWLSELRDRLWTSRNTGYQVLNLVISYALRDGADGEQRATREINEGLRSDVADREAALRRAVGLVRAVWDRSASGTTAITAVVEGNGGDANHWSGVVRWVHGAEVESEGRPAGALSRDLEELRADVVQLLQEVDFWTKSAGYWRALVLSRGAHASDEAIEGER